MIKTTYPIFSVTGIEVEYMIVNHETLEPSPIADRIIKHIHGEIVNEVDLGVISISNELACHVIELKTTQPMSDLVQIEQALHQQINVLNDVCRSFGAMLLPTGAHPWLDPNQAQLWPHGSREIYHAYDQIFGCQGHGWVNLQSTHVNLPFSNESEFVALHRAIRYILPLIPALTASTPVLDGCLQPFADTRLSFYGQNQKLIPAISGDIIPEDIETQAAYTQQILEPMYQAIKPFDSKNILQHEWLNSRGAIARFDRDAIEIRLLDTQECIAADLACVALITSVIKWLSKESLPKISTHELKDIYSHVIQAGSRTEVHNTNYLHGLKLSSTPQTCAEIWAQMFQATKSHIPECYYQTLDVIIKENLSERLRASLQNNDSHESIRRQYQRLANCLAKNELYR